MVGILTTTQPTVKGSLAAVEPICHYRVSVRPRFALGGPVQTCLAHFGDEEGDTAATLHLLTQEVPNGLQNEYP